MYKTVIKAYIIHLLASQRYYDREGMGILEEILNQYKKDGGGL